MSSLVSTKSGSSWDTINEGSSWDTSNEENRAKPLVKPLILNLRLQLFPGRHEPMRIIRPSAGVTCNNMILQALQMSRRFNFVDPNPDDYIVFQTAWEDDPERLGRYYDETQEVNDINEIENGTLIVIRSKKDEMWLPYHFPEEDWDTGETLLERYRRQEEGKEEEGKLRPAIIN